MQSGGSSNFGAIRSSIATDFMIEDGSNDAAVNEGIALLKERFSAEELERMSPSDFYSEFKKVTA